MTEQAIILHSLFLMKTWTFRQRLVTDYDFIQLVNFTAWSANYVCIFHRIPDIAQQSFTSLWFALTEQDKSNFQTDPETGTPPPVLSLHREKVPRRMCVFLYSAVGVCGILRCRVNMGVGGEARTTDPAIALCRLLLSRMLHLIANLNWMPIFFHNLLSTATQSQLSCACVINSYHWLFYSLLVCFLYPVHFTFRKDWIWITQSCQSKKYIQSSTTFPKIQNTFILQQGRIGNIYIAYKENIVCVVSFEFVLLGKATWLSLIWKIIPWHSLAAIIDSPHCLIAILHAHTCRYSIPSFV